MSAAVSSIRCRSPVVSSTSSAPRFSSRRCSLRDRVAELALIGIAVSERGRWDGGVVVVGLDIASAGAAVRAVP
ncbi:hypothetical protein A6A06_37770 [Streptomyces sp. CB02923]|nr:hypothetical protein A6A06_37770 [Streptomyces sp. CB02923]